MLYIVVLVLLIAAGFAAFWWLARLVFTPKETYTKKRSSAFGPIYCCRHCDTVITGKNRGEHGTNCAKRPPDLPKPRRA
jgi:hypothetical protein